MLHPEMLGTLLKDMYKHWPWSILISMVLQVEIWNLVTLVKTRIRHGGIRRPEITSGVWRCQVDQSETIPQQNNSTHQTSAECHLKRLGAITDLQVHFTSDSFTQQSNSKKRQEWITTMESGWQSAFQPAGLKWPVALTIHSHLH